ncbi:hypothetical protein B0T20DRAFT_17704 [Sordaria brevicollis]|uniref:Secreted protein n=1 Tax=Sordaria brevicollis TaxID=83679 RepID=A0AAE0UGF6_SORBR|nr:hypothetical protein B0T20DRAFT_17704 [Sordaria brevicollis]
MCFVRVRIFDILLFAAPHSLSSAAPNLPTQNQRTLSPSIRARCCLVTPKSGRGLDSRCAQRKRPRRQSSQPTSNASQKYTQLRF